MVNIPHNKFSVGYTILGECNIFTCRDILLLEAGFLTIFVAPLKSSSRKKQAPADAITFWSLRWLLFRLMFASGIVKFTSGCPTWWGLTGRTIYIFNLPVIYN
jgi:hypothetical protein